MAQFEPTLEAPLDIEAIVDAECERLKIPPFNDATDWQDRLARTLVLYRLGAAAERDAVEKELKVAIDEVLGAGTFANVVSELYDALRAKN